MLRSDADGMIDFFFGRGAAFRTPLVTGTDG
jgi:hypothetical protein